MAKPAATRPSPFERRWQAKIGNNTAYRTMVCRGHLVYWTGIGIKSIDIATGAVTGKAKADGGAPWATADGIWLPTTKGFELRTPDTLAVERTLVVPSPKGMTYVGGVARLYGASSYRLFRANAGTAVDGANVQDYLLQAYDLDAKQQRYLASLGGSANPSVRGDCTADAFAVAFRGDDGFKVIVGSTIDGTITGTSVLAHGNLDVVAGQLIDRTVAEDLPVLRDGAWRTPGVRGHVAVIDGAVFCIGHRELVRLDAELEVATRVAIAYPGTDEHLLPPTSACRIDETLIVVEPGPSYWATKPVAKPTTPYRLVRRDPDTLNELDADEFTELFGLHLLGHVDGMLVAKVFNGFIGLSLRG